MGAAFTPGTGYREIVTPVGRLLLAATCRGLVRVVYVGETNAPALKAALPGTSPPGGPGSAEPPPSSISGTLDDAARQIQQYFAGARRVFDVRLDLRLPPGFRRRVLAHLPNISYGHTETYSQVAQALGNPTAVRAAGTACAANPLPVVIPCHRVIRSDGSLGGYAGGIQAKGKLLALEAAVAGDLTVRASSDPIYCCSARVPPLRRPSST